MCSMAAPEAAGRCERRQRRAPYHALPCSPENRTLCISTPSLPPGVCRARRPGAAALKEIRRYQSHGKRLIPRAPFHRLLREMLHDIKTDLRISGKPTWAVCAGVGQYEGMQ